ncbi:MAG: hypothetical protein AB7O57_15680, partial [Hyphomicrobiaceae bacterium]
KQGNDMLPPHQPARRKKLAEAKPLKPSVAKPAAAGMTIVLTPKAAREMPRPAMRVLGRTLSPSPATAVRPRRIGPC